MTMRNLVCGLLLLATIGPVLAVAPPLPTIETHTVGFRRIDGYVPLYWDAAGGRLWMEVSRLDQEFLWIAGLSAGLGSNDIGLDRGSLRRHHVVFFERVGPKLLLVAPNYDFRALAGDVAETATVRASFPRSVLWGFAIAAESPGRLLVDLTDWLLRDGLDLGRELKPARYELDATRSSIRAPALLGFPKNTELDAELTFVRNDPDANPQPGFFEGAADVAATAEALSLTVHHSFVELPPLDFLPLPLDPRAGYFTVDFQDRVAALDRPLDVHWAIRHRLERQDRNQPVGPPVRPIVYYLDRATPEPMRSALLEGARWWAKAFEAAGFVDAFQVEIMPPDMHPLDARYNVIDWVHRSTRGWSYGDSVVDPRTGEILKGVVSLGSLRVRQDWLLAEGLLAPYSTGSEPPLEVERFALGRLRQLAAHEVGHTLGLEHNYFNSRRGRISVMDYPHPLVTLGADGTIETADAYAVGIGAWDEVAIDWGYRQYAEGVDAAAARSAVLDRAAKADLVFLTNQDLDVHPRADQWANGVDTAAELERVMKVRRAALERFDERALRAGRPLAELEEVLVPLFLHHRYQVRSTAATLGGQDYRYSRRGDGGSAFERPSGTVQRRALDALLATLRPEELVVPARVLALIPPRPIGSPATRELFPRTVGPVFDAVTPGQAAAELVVEVVLDAERLARLEQQHALDDSLPGAGEAIGRLVATAFASLPTDAYQQQLAFVLRRTVVDRLMGVAARAAMAQVRALAESALVELAGYQDVSAKAPGALANARQLKREIERFLARPSQPATPQPAPFVPPGPPIGAKAGIATDGLECMASPR